MNQPVIFTQSLGKAFRAIVAGSSNGDPRRLASIVKSASEARALARDSLGIHVPEMCFFSVTWECNLECAGCYAKGFSTADNLSIDEIEHILLETTGFGTVLYAVAGGEPLAVPGLLETLARVDSGIYMVFTNGTLFDDQAVATVRSTCNILPVISVEGDTAETEFRRGNGVGASVAAAMDRLRAAGVPFAYSTMVTHRNLDYVTSRDYQRAMWRAGARFGFLVDYLPIPGSYESELELTEEDRALKRERVNERIGEARPLLVNFPEAEYRRGGCMSAGAGFVHISATGDVEPCVFSHYSTHNLRRSSYLEALSSPFFQEIRDRFSEEPNPTGTCMLLKHQPEVAAIAGRYGAKETLPETANELVAAG
jgi:MoaA/NifB/PqqE/SkfB family radical SAM enzyme